MLCFAGETFAEAMLVGVEDMVCFQVTHEITYNDMLQKFAADACQGNRAVVGRGVSVSLIVEWGNIDMFRIVWHLTFRE